MAHEASCPHYGQPKCVPTGKKTEGPVKMFSPGNIGFDEAVVAFFFGSLAFLATIYWIFRDTL
jgi:hypothetical protein